MLKQHFSLIRLATIHKFNTRPAVEKQEVAYIPGERENASAAKESNLAIPMKIINPFTRGLWCSTSATLCARYSCMCTKCFWSDVHRSIVCNRKY